MRRHVLAGLATAGLLLTACGADAALSQKMDTQVQRLATVEAGQTRLAELEAQSQAVATVQAQVAVLSQSQATGDTASPDLADLQARVAALEATIGEMQIEHTAEHVATAPGGTTRLEIATVQYLLDGAGLHEMDERLNETKTVSPEDAAAIRRLNKVLAAVTWPEALKTEGDAFAAVLLQFQEALEADDAAQAAALATEVHGKQHALSHSIDTWLGQEGHDH